MKQQDTFKKKIEINHLWKQLETFPDENFEDENDILSEIDVDLL